MNGQTQQWQYLGEWIAFTAIMLVAILLVVIWAAKAGQFRGQDRARHLPLTSGIPDEDDTAQGKQTNVTGQETPNESKSQDDGQTHGGNQDVSA